MSDWSDYAREVQAAADSAGRRADTEMKSLKRRIQELEAELHLMKTAGVIEVASRNINVSDYVSHWEGRTEKAEAENEKLRLGLEVYSRERDRYRHNKPEISGAYFLSGGHGQKDDNMMPQFVEICPAYGCAWVKIYEDTGRTISYEGS